MRRETKRFAHARKPTPVIPPTIALVHIHVQVVIPTVADRVTTYKTPSKPLPFEYSQGCILFGITIPQCSAPSIFIFCAFSYTTLPEAVTADILDVWILDSVTGSRNRLLIFT